MRPKKDPQIRREAFIDAASQLFSEHGFENVSIRDVLDAVGDKSSSPSVFYYYFASKEELYRCVVASIARTYVASFDEGFTESGPLEERAADMLNNAIRGLTVCGNMIAGTGTTRNRLFMLDMRDQVTRAMACKWTPFLIQEGLASPETAEALALYITGGISQLLFSQLELGAPTNAEAYETLQHAASFVMATLDLTLDLPDESANESEQRENQKNKEAQGKES